MKKNLLVVLLVLLSFIQAEAQWSSLSDVNNLVSSTIYDQMNPKIINDGVGGYIISWTDKNPSDFNVWAQRLNSSGAPLWGTNGIAVCATSNHQILSGIVSDGAGGAIIVWEDSTGTGGGGSQGMNDVFAQRISSSGTKMWATAGVSICSATDLQSNVNIISDNSNGAIIVWHDYRTNGYLESDIYAQRINGSGVIQWLSNGLLVSGAANQQINPRICADGSGGAYIAWEDYRLSNESEIFLQRLNASGTALFAANGINACTAPNDQMYPELISNGVGGAFISWYDKRFNGNLGPGDLYGQNVDAAGNMLWGISGLSLCNAAGDQFASFYNLAAMTSDGSGGFYYAWNDLRNGSHNVYMQRYNSSGTGLWTLNGVAVNNSSFNEVYASVVPDGNGGVYVTWDRYGNGSIDVYAQRIDGNGNALWVANGIPAGNAMNSQFGNQLVTNGDGTAIVVFNDKRNNVDYNIYAQKIISVGLCIPPPINITATTTNLCIGSSVTLTASGASTYSWSTLGNGSSKVVSPNTSTVYTVTATAANGCTNTASILINVLGLPTVTATSSSTSICPGTSITLTGGGADTYQWNNNVNNATQTLVPTTTTTYTVTGTSSNGCSSTSTVQIVMNNVPSITISPTVSTVCLGKTATITASGASSYLWNTGVTSAALTVSPSVTTTYTVTGTNSYGCTATATKTMNVNNLPNIVVTPANPAICIGSSVTLLATGAGSYTWVNLGTGASKTVSPTSTTTYTVTGTSGTGCSNSTTKTVTVNPLPSVTISPSAPFVCQGESTTLVAGGANAYVWANNSNTNSTITISPVNTSIYTVTGTSGAGCTGTATTTVTVLSVPTVSITPSSVTICLGSSTTLTASSSGSTYQWTNLGTNSTQSVSPSVTTTYTVTATNSSGCTATASRTVTVISGPPVAITPSSISICAGSTVTLTATNATSYAWTNYGTSSTQSVTPSGTTIYTVTGTNASGCTSSTTALVTVSANPLTTISATSTTVCQGDSVVLTGSGALTYNWHTLGSGASQTVFPLATTTYTVTGTNATGCTSSNTLTISVNPFCNTVLTTQCLVQGYYIGNGLMTPALYNESESTDLLACDSIIIGLHATSTPYNVLFSAKVPMNTNGISTWTLPTGAQNNSYYISIQFRNAVQLWSAYPVNMNGNQTYNFTNAANKAFGDNQTLVDSILNLYAAYSGDINQDGATDSFDYLLLDPDIFFGNGGYLPTDLNGDGAADSFDYLILDPNIFNGIGAAAP